MPIPLRSDRSAHDVNSYPELHARDLDDGAPKYHLTPGTAPYSFPMWDGSKWASWGPPDVADSILYWDGNGWSHIAPPAQADSLMYYDGADWVFVPPPPTPMSLLAYNGASFEWIGPPAEPDKVAVWNGSTWVYDDFKIAALRDVQLDTLEAGQALVWNAETNAWVNSTVGGSDADTLDGEHASGFLRLGEYNEQYIMNKPIFFNLSVGEAPFDVADQCFGVVTNLNADRLDGRHWDEIAGIADGVHYYVAPAPTGSDSNSGLTAFTPFATIQKAISKLQGHILRQCAIHLDPGTYIENVDLSGLVASYPHLTIYGDTGGGVYRLNVGQSYIHGGQVMCDNSTYQGNGTVSLACVRDSGNGNRIKITVNCSTRNPNFSADGIVAGDRILLSDGASWTEYTIHATSGNQIWLTSTATAPALATNGRGFVILPNVRVYTTSGAAWSSVGAGCRFYGVHFLGEHNGLSLGLLSHALVHNCVSRSTSSASYIGATAIGQWSFLQNSSYPFTSIGGYAGIVMSGAFANCQNASVYGFANGLRVSWNSEYYGEWLNVFAGTNIGSMALLMSHARNLASVSSNFAINKFSPAVSDQFGNNNGSITFS